LINRPNRHGYLQDTKNCTQHLLVTIRLVAVFLVDEKEKHGATFKISKKVFRLVHILNRCSAPVLLTNVLQCRNSNFGQEQAGSMQAKRSATSTTHYACCSVRPATSLGDLFVYRTVFWICNEYLVNQRMRDGLIEFANCSVVSSGYGQA
jgi:hypothetical protein